MMVIKLLFLFIVVQILAASCKRNHSKKEIEDAMKHYDRLIQKMDADSISLSYTQDGDLGDVAHGRQAIKKFLSGFKNVRVLSQTSYTKSIEVLGDSCIQKGNYIQVALVPDTVKVKGSFIAKWIWGDKQGWLLKSMITQPLE